ncbi:MAG: PepSY-associated TM helix domain-containing protein [Bacteroidales bacterium]|nr:PepSY-associated TM helix domain-containing protein [Bacteroidales bacterium]
MNHEITAKKTVYHQYQLDKDLDKDAIKDFISTQPHVKLNKVMPKRNGYQLFIGSGIGEYNSKLGMLEIETYEQNKFIDFVHSLHYNTVKGWKYMADFLAVTLVFFAISGMFLTRGKKSIRGRGKWFVVAGIVVVLLFTFL